MEVLVCSECGRSFERPGGRGPIPTRCPECKIERKRAKHAEQERARLARRAQGQYKCGHCGKTKDGSEFAASQLKDGRWCRDCYRATYVERSGGYATKVCPIDGTKFQVTRRNERQTYCSKRCKERASQIRESELKREAKRGRPCGNNCGREIPVGRHSNARYCSEDCRRQHVGSAIRRRSMLKTTYGLTPEAFDAIVEAQGGRCAICLGDDPGVKGVWHVDHCHDTNAVRGLLCTNCNTGLGQFKDDPDVLRRAVDYLEKARLE